MLTTTAPVSDVARYILDRMGTMSTMKLHKLVYYAQAWSLVWDECPLFSEIIEAGDHGPMVPALYQQHAGPFLVAPSDVPGDPSQLDTNAKDTLDAVLAFYGPHTAQWLGDLARQEDPWRQMRDGPIKGEITLAALHEYYSGLSG